MDQGVGHLAAGGFENPGEGGAGDAHLRRGLFLVEAVEVGEAQGFQLVEG